MFRLRQNLLLKIISLAASVILYIYVQGERYPSVTRTLIATLQTENLPPGMEVETAQQQVDVSATGPRPIMDRLKDSNIRAVVDLHDFAASEVKSGLARIVFSIQSLPPEMVREITLDPPSKTVRVQVFPQQTKWMAVHSLYPKDSPAGYKYGRPEVSPARVKITGRADRLNRVAELVANAVPSEMGATIDGDFPVSARDSDNKPVEEITLIPDTVHISIPLVEEPTGKIVTISPIVAELPLPPYRITGMTAIPPQVKITGRPEKINQIFTLQTEDIFAREFTDNQLIDAALAIPGDVIAYDMDGHLITHVKVHLIIRKESVPAGTPSHPASPPGQAASP